MNTFDYQRVTRLTPLELTIGKLLGAPVLTFLIVLGLMPVALWAAFVADVNLITLAEIYALLVIGAFIYGLLALLASLLVGQGSSAGAILFYLVLVGMSSIDYSEGVSRFAVHKLSPFFAIDLISHNSAPVSAPVNGIPPLQDFFFGASVPHVAVLTVIYLTFAAWFLIALVRNLKRDPAIYEVFSPVQAFALVL